ncbi:Alpha/Beta hydrolase fold [Phytophthora cactorum]|nr:Alpha/Beta hydrolase fold [Phytophthora cactorum]
MRVYALLRTAVVVPVLSASLPTVELDYTTVQAVGGNTTLPPQENDANTGANLADADVACTSTEDCLYLDGLFDLSQDFIFVACNYRLGITGLAHGPSYQHEGGAANLVVWDSARAFKWVKTYIDKFGGNPNDVTAVGFSAGGSQVMFQMTRFGGNAPQLFEKAYIMSPGYVPGAGHHHAVQFWQNVSSVGCDGGHLGCMREVDFSTLQDAASEVVSEYTYQYQHVWMALLFRVLALACDQSYYWYSTYTLSTSSSTLKRAQATGSASSYYASERSGRIFRWRGWGDGCAGGDSSVNSTVAIMMQTYLLSFVITGNSNTMWPDDKLYWPQYNESSVGTEIVFDGTFTVADDDLANSKSLFWNKALWY